MQNKKGEALNKKVESYQQLIAEEGKFMQLMDKGRECIAILNPQIQSLNASLASVENPHQRFSKENGLGGTAQTTKLSEIQLKDFNGDPLQWPTFWDSFEVAVDQQPIPDIQKLNYLLLSLEGSAEKAVADYAVKL